MMLTTLSELKAMRGGGRKVAGCSEHLYKKKAPTDVAMRAWEDHVTAEEDKRRRYRIVGCSRRLSPEKATKKKQNQKKKILPDDRIADLNNRMYYTPVERDCDIARRIRAKEQTNTPSRSQIYFNEDQANECIERVYKKESADRRERHAVLLSKYLSSQQPNRRFTPSEMMKSNKRLYTEAIAESVRVTNKGVSMHCPPLKIKLALTACQWNDTVSRLYPATARG